MNATHAMMMLRANAERLDGGVSDQTRKEIVNEAAMMFVEYKLAPARFSGMYYEKAMALLFALDRDMIDAAKAEAMEIARDYIDSIEEE